MKSKSELLEEIQDTPFAFTQTLLDNCDEVEVEQRLASICKSTINGNSADVRIFAVGLAHMINDAMMERAYAMSQSSVTPLDNDTNEADWEREK